MRKDLHLRLYRIIQIQKRLFSENKKRQMEMTHLLTKHPTVFDRVWFTNEAHFRLDGHVDSYRAVHWESSAPDKVLTEPLHSRKVTAHGW